MDVDVDIVKGEDEDEKTAIVEDIIVEDHSTTSSNQFSVDLISAMGEKTSSSTLTNIAMLKRKGSSDTIKTLLSSPPATTIDEVPLVKRLPPTPYSDPSPLLPQQ